MFTISIFLKFSLISLSNTTSFDFNKTYKSNIQFSQEEIAVAIAIPTC